MHHIPLTDEQLRARRAVMLPVIKRHNHEYFTCDQCELRWRCEYVFDAYNTAGDCLADQ